jgi:alanine dehydrogenase
MLYYLTEAEVRVVLRMDDAIRAVDASFKKMAVEEATNIPRQRCQTDNAMLHVLPAAAKTLQALGLKAYTTGRFDAQFYLFLFDPNKGGLTAIVEADHLGAMRTGASSGVATLKLAREDASTVGLFGTGKQARTQLEAMVKVRNITSVDVYGRDVTKREQFAKEMSALLGIDVKPASTAEETARDKDIVITATTSRDPVLLGKWLREGTHLNIMGSNHLSKAEVDVDTITRCQLITIDSIAQGRMECGDFKQALEENKLLWSNVKELAPVLVGRYPGRENETDITMFKSLGLGIQDIAVGVRVVELAKQRGLGRTLDTGS